MYLKNVQSPDFQMLAVIFLEASCVVCELLLAYKPSICRLITAHKNFTLGANPPTTITSTKT